MNVKFFRIAQMTDITVLLGCPIVFYNNMGSHEPSIFNIFQFLEFFSSDFRKSHWTIELKLSKGYWLNFHEKQI